MRAIVIAVALLLTATGGYAQQRGYRNRNGVRLEGGLGPRGRIELSSTDSWFNNYTMIPVKPAWNSICDEDFDETLAVIMCTMLGYTHGRKVYDAPFNHRGNISMDARIGRITCTPRLQTSRGLRVTSSEVQTGISGQGALEGQGAGRSSARASRLLYEPLLGIVNSPLRSPYICSFRGGRCDTRGPLAGIECGFAPFPPAPPRPPAPRPPSPAPTPTHPAFSTSIRLVGGRPIDRPEENVEANLSCDGDVACEAFGRVELQVPSLGTPGAKIWAPVCAIADPVLAFSVSYITCMQVFDWTDPRSGVIVITPQLNAAFRVPTAPVSSSSHFNPTTYNGWITIQGVGAEPFMPNRVQDFNYTVSTTPCRSLLGVQCQVFGALRDH